MGKYDHLIQWSDQQDDGEIYNKIWYTETMQQDLLQDAKSKEHNTKNSREYSRCMKLFIIYPSDKDLDTGRN